MSKEKTKKSFLSTKFDKIASWYVPDENGHINRPAQIKFHALCLLPLLIFEGIKIGIYQSFAPHNETGFYIFGKGLLTPFIKVLQMKNTAAFGHSLNGGQFAPQYLLLLLTIWFVAFIKLYVDADRRKDLSAKKDGDIKFASLKEYNRDFAYPQGEDGFSEPDEENVTVSNPGNMIITKNARFSLAGTGDLYSCVWVQGSIGSGKSFTYVKPNILQMNSSYVVTDPSCELITSLGTCLMQHGYDVKLFNLKRGEHQFSCRYNPFAYIHDEQDVVLTVDAFLSASTDGGNGGDPFFPIAEKNFYYALFYYIYTVLPKNERTLKAVFELYLEADESDKPIQKPKSKDQLKNMSEAEKAKMAKDAENGFDKKFKELAKKDPFNPCLAFYKTFKNGSPKTKQSILISVGVKMWFLSVGSTANLLSGDDLNLERIGDRKTALFVAIPTDNASFKCLSAMMFTQLFQTLYYFGDTVNNNSYLLKTGNCVAARSNMFKAGSVSEKSEYNKINALKNIYLDAFVIDENELRKTDEELDKKLSTPNKDGDYLWPKSHIVVDATVHPEVDSDMFKDEEGDLKYKKTDDGKYFILESFNDVHIANYVLNAAKIGKIERGGIGHINHIRFILDEFFAIGKIADFDAKIATFRKYKISADIITQSISQLAEMYEDKQGKIISNCDIKICLGANDLDDAKFFSDICGQTTVKSESINLDRKGDGLANASGGSISDNAQMLIRPEWILAQMKGNTALVYTRTMGPFKDRKYISTEHPRWKETFNDRDLEHTEHLRFEYRKIFCIEQKLENRVKVDIDFGDEDDVVAIEQAPPVKGIASKAELQEKYANVYAPAPKPGIERHKASAHPSAKAIFEEQKTIFEEHIQYQKSQGNDEFKKSIVKEFGSAMNNDGTLPSSVLPNDVKMKFSAALRNNTGEYKVNEDTNEVTLDEDYLGDIMNQVANLH